MNLYLERYRQFLEEFGKGKLMVLSTVENDRVTSRMMSIIRLGGEFYFQTDRTFRKYSQLVNHPQIALCADNIQLEGVCREIGHPLEHNDFCQAYEECFSGSFRRYSALKNERLFSIVPVFIERWKYIDAKPVVETFDIEKRAYKLSEYTGR